MKSYCIAVLLSFFLTAQAVARLGESEAELVKRFGPPTQRSSEKTATQGRFHEVAMRLTFRQGDWTIESSLVDGRCARERYSKVGEWSEEQIAQVLDSNAQGAKWTQTSKASSAKVLREWRRDDGATATWKLRVMVITHPAFEREKARVEAKAKADASKSPKI